MIISKIQQYNPTQEYIKNNNKFCTIQSARYNLSPLNCDTFTKTTPQTNFNTQMPRRNVSFLGGIANISNAFEHKFTKGFFKKLLREGIPDAYSDITLIPPEDIDILKAMGDLNKKSSIAIRYLREYRDNMFPIEKEIFTMLETLSKKHPELTLQELIQLKHSNSEQILINQQSNILNKISQISKNLPKKEFLEIRKLIQASYNKIFTPEPIPEERFGRKEFINRLKVINIADSKIKQKMLSVAEKLPQSSDSIHAFIVKYSEPYKVVHNRTTGEIIRIPRDSQEIGLRLLMPSVGTDDHIHPQKAFRLEEKARQSGNKAAQNLSRLKVTILTSKKTNELKSDTPIDDFITLQNSKIPANIQKQINRLIEITEKWYKNGRLQDAVTLSDYIVTLQKEFNLRSSKVKIDISDFEEKIPQIKEKAKISQERKEQKRIKKQGHADNNHKEQYIEKNGHILENRKIQRHSPRYGQ